MTLTLAALLAFCPAGISAAAAEKKADLITKKFDLGNKGTASGYIGVSATDAYTKAKGYGFHDTTLTKNVSAKGSGALSDAVHFQGSDGQFKVDLPTGVYKITVTTGNVEAVTVVAEGYSQLFFLTGNNASDSFTIPITDGQLNIHATSGKGSEYSLCTIEIEQTSTGTTTKPTIWIVGDVTSAAFYNVSSDSKRGWGEYLHKYVDMNKYDIRNLSVNSIRAQSASSVTFPTAEHYGKSGDILILPIGIDDYIDAYNANPSSPDPTSYINSMTDLVRRAKKKDMKVYLVKQHTLETDIHKYPIPSTKWFNADLEKLAKSENTGILDLHRPFLELLLENYYYERKEYFAEYNLYTNSLGADTLAEMVSAQLFPKKVKKATPTPTGTPTVLFQTENSGKAISNPHKGFVMTAYTPQMITSEHGFEYGIGGSANNRAWDVVTIVSGSPKWSDLNPEPGIYKWDEIDAMLDTCEKYGLTYGIRIMPYSSYLGKDYVPQWVYAKGAKKYTAKSSEDETVEVVFPKWDDPIYIQAHKDFVKALAQKYDGDPRVEFIDIRPFGDYGEWHNSFVVDGDTYMPSLEIEKDMLDFYDSAFSKSLIVLPSNARGEIYQYAISLGIAKRDDGLISLTNAEWSLRPAYKANLPVLGENYWPYAWMRDTVRGNEYSLINWTQTRFRETIEISHLTIFALDQDSNCSYGFYNEQKDIIDEMCNRLGYNYTVTSAALYGNKLVVTVKNTGLAPSFFNIDLCAEITDANGNKIGNFGSPVRIAKGSFHDDTEQTFEFVYSGTLASDATICLAMYDVDNPLVKGKDPTVKFDNKNNLSNNRLKLVPVSKTPTPTGKVSPAPTGKVSPTPTKAGTPAPTGKTSPAPTGKTTPVPSKPGTPSPTGKVTPAPTGIGAPTHTLMPNQTPTKAGTPVPTKNGTPVPSKGVSPSPTKPGTPAPTGMVTPIPTGGGSTSPTPGGGLQPTVSSAPRPTGEIQPTVTSAPGTTVTGIPTPTQSPSIADFVERLYTIALDRESEPEGKAFWINEIESGNRTGGDCAHFFLIEAPEFLNRGLSDDDFVETLYRTFFDRDSEAAGKAFWVGELKRARMTRQDVIGGFIDSKEWCNVCATYGVRSGAPHAKAEFASRNAIGFATRLYTCCLGREPEQGGLDYWSLALTNLEKTGCEAAAFFFTGDEFVGFGLNNDEYVRRLYTTFMGRDPETSEIAYWVGEIDKGTQTKASVMAFFGQSPEFTNICKTYGIERGEI